MSVTSTAKDTLQKVLDRANPAQLGDALAKVKLGTLLTPTKKTFTGLTASDTHDLTDAEHGNSPAVLDIVSLRVVDGDAAAGVRKIGDVDATPDANIATLSDDGKTLVFEDTVTDFVIAYVPRPDADMTADFFRS